MVNELRRRRWIVRRRLEGWTVPRIAEALKVSEKTVDRWWGLARNMGGRGYASNPKLLTNITRHLKRQ